MKVLFFGSRNLTWKHFRVMRATARHAILATPPDLGTYIIDLGLQVGIGMREPNEGIFPDSEPLICIHGDGPPGSATPGAIGADKLAELACMETWPERRRVRRFPPKPGEGESWGQAAAQRNAAMVATKPDRAYCVHTDLDSSKGSRMTADMLQNAGLHFRYVRVNPAGALVSVEHR